MDPSQSANINDSPSEDLKPFVLKDLLESRNIDWGWINKIFKTSPGFFEEVLFRIHYKRNKTLIPEDTLRILLFLSTGYLSTNDVRYFNEFLWFYKENDHGRDLVDGCMERFNANLNENSQHCLPKELLQCQVDAERQNLNKVHIDDIPPLRICLIGFPPFFGTIIKQLKKEGHYVEQFFLPFHPNRHINRLMKLKLPVKLLSILKGNFYSYRTLNYDYKDKRIGQEIRAGNFDIGFHKLNFIIKENIFNSFRIGLLNDHWGYLPLLRGKSTIAYSLLLGVPVISTIHFINQGIDSGSIVGYQPYVHGNAGSVSKIRSVLRMKMPERILAAIKLAGSSTFTTIENAQNDGQIFYEIHPWLNTHINSRILKK